MASHAQITFTPPAGTYSGTQTVTVSGPSGQQIFCTTDGSQPTAASARYTGPFTVSANITINCAAAATTIAAQAIQNAPSSWGTNVASTSAQSAPYAAYYNTPNIKWGPGNTSQGTSGTPTAINFLTGLSSPTVSGDNKTAHLNFTTQNITGANCNSSGGGCTSQTQVLWPNDQSGCESCTFQVQDLYLYPADTTAQGYAHELDMVQWTTSRHWILGASLQCWDAGSQWQYNGQSGSWQNFGSTTSIYKNGVLYSGTLSEGCPLATGRFTHVQYHATFYPGYQGCVVRGTTTAAECVFIDYLIINNDKYTFGTQTISGQTFSALVVDAAVLPSGYPSRCFNQLQIDTAGTGASPTNPITVGEYVDQDNMTCGTGSTTTAAASYVIGPPPTAATPTSSPAAGYYASPQTVTLADTTPGAAIHYTLDGSTPTTSSPVYTTPLLISTTTQVQAIAAASGYNNSAVLSATYAISIPIVATPTAAPSPGTYTSAQTVSLSDSTTGAAICYTTDGSTPTATSGTCTHGSTYASPIAVGSTTTIKAIGSLSGYTNSILFTGLYTISIPPPPSFSGNVIFGNAAQTGNATTH